MEAATRVSFGFSPSAVGGGGSKAEALDCQPHQFGLLGVRSCRSSIIIGNSNYSNNSNNNSLVKSSSSSPSSWRRSKSRVYVRAATMSAPPTVLVTGSGGRTGQIIL